MMLHREKGRQLLRRRDYKTLLIEEMGWNDYDYTLPAEVFGDRVILECVAEKAGVVLAVCRHTPLPDYRARGVIERALAKQHREHLLVFAPEGDSRQLWLWVSREPNRPLRRREYELRDGQSGEALMQKLDVLCTELAEERDLTTVDMTSRMRAGFDVDRVTRSFYERFRKEHDALVKMVSGIPDDDLAHWYVAVTLNRLMFIYFIQRKGFLDGDPHYLANRLRDVQQGGKNRFYRQFLCPLFFEGFARPPASRDPQIKKLLGDIPYLNGGIFARHEVEQHYGRDIDIPDAAFERIFRFFDEYNWHLDDRPLREDKEINPDVLGYIFEKYINQKEMGAYYTKEDITGYIARNTIIPRLFDMAREGCRVAFEGDQSVWRWLSDDPDRYIYHSVRHGCDLPLPPEVAAGLSDVSGREVWNTPAPETHALPTEIWRETIARRQRYEEVWTQLVEGRVRSANDLITLNLDIQQFAQDVIERSEGPELVRAFWKALNAITILDPACGSGAFLFAALNLLEPLYWACLGAMQGFIEQAEREGAPRSRYSDFREILARVSDHPSKEYFILKAIILNNLYGVDIMPEAVEIARLRLFLKLAAQVEDKAKLEPLPDIDFNVRAGNSLVGFANIDEAQRALAETRTGRTAEVDARQARMTELSPEEAAAVQRIVAAAEDVDELYQKFRLLQMSSVREQAADDLARCKLQLKDRLGNLATKLDAYLAQQYGAVPQGSQTYKEWRRRHMPFHWLAEFYGVMRESRRKPGFDVIVGNPPYVEYAKVRRDYTLKWYRTLPCGNLYAIFVERGLALLTHGGALGMIVPHSAISTDRMEHLQALFRKRHLWVSTYDIRPSKLFLGVDQRLAICVSLGTAGREIYSTRYHRWLEEFRPYLFQCLRYANVCDIEPKNSIPKIGTSTEVAIYHKLASHPPLGSSLYGSNRIYFHNAPRYWVRAMVFVPYFWNERNGQQLSTQMKPLSLADPSAALACAALLNSSLFYWWFVLLSDCRHLNMREIESFPSCLSSLTTQARTELEELTRRLMIDLKSNAIRKQAYYKTTGRIEYDEFYPRLSKPIIDEIDTVLARHYGLTPEELDYIINYDIKFRMGLDNLAEDGEGEED